jgi:hypothetical protein
MSDHLERITPEELEKETAHQLPDKEVVSLLDLFVNVDLALDLAAPVDLAVAANANAAAPIDAAVTANVLSLNSDAGALTTQNVSITQGLDADAIADAPQSAVVDQSNDVVDGGTSGGSDVTDAIVPEEQVAGVTTEPVGAAVGDTVDGVTGGVTDTVGGVGDTVDGVTGGVTDTVGGVGDTVDGVTGDATDIVGGVTGGGLLDGDLLNVDVNVTLDTDMAAPIAGAVAANANIAAPIDASAAANVASVDSTATAIAQQTAVIDQTIEDSTAQATADQDADITQ